MICLTLCIMTNIVFLLLSILCIAANLSSLDSTEPTYTTVYGKYRHYISNRHNFHFVCYFVKYLVYKVISIKDWCKTYAVPMSSRAWKLVCTLTCSQTISNYLAFQPFDFERTWWSLFQKRIVYTTLDIYVFITVTGSTPPLVDY